MADAISRHANAWPDKPALVFVAPGLPDLTMTYGELADAMLRTAGGVLERGLSGRTVGLYLPAGLDFVVALLGCFAAGAVAVPIAPAGRRKDRSAAIASILSDCDAGLAIVSPADVQELADGPGEGPRMGGIPIVSIDALLSTPPRRIASQPDSLALLQYTSGSTSRPKGVMLSHATIMANQAMIKAAFGHDASSDFVGWAPHFHDQGLFGNILQPLYLGALCVLMAPATFLRQPLFWLETIGRFRAHTSGGPNFAYELCVEHLRRGARAFDANLSSWRNAFNGAEPVRATTMRTFARAFAEHGFDPNAVFPCYGLAECTLFTTGRTRREQELATVFDTDRLAVGEAVLAKAPRGGREIVCCGPAPPGAEIVIADQRTHRLLGPGRLGEIWIAGGHVAQGYWRRPEDTSATFVVEPVSGRRFLRSGDLGFLWQGELYVADRKKDLIIVRGRNIYPHDVEEICVAASDVLAPTAVAAVPLEGASGQAVCVVAEARRSSRRELDIVALAKTLKEAVSGELGVALESIVVIAPGALPKTTSGKAQRRRTLRLLLDGGLPILASIGLPASVPTPVAPSETLTESSAT